MGCWRAEVWMWGDGLGQRKMWGEEGGLGQRWGCGKVMWGRGEDVGQDQASGQAEAALVPSSPYKGNVVALALPVPPLTPPADSRMGGKGPQLTHGGNWGVRGWAVRWIECRCLCPPHPAWRDPGVGTCYMPLPLP